MLYPELDMKKSTDLISRLPFRYLLGTQGYSKVLKGTQGYSKVLKGTQGYSRVLKGTQGYARVLKSTLSCPNFMQNYV